MKNYHYEVEVGYRRFCFFDQEEAVSFANMAYETIVGDKYPDICINLVSNDKNDKNDKIETNKEDNEDGMAV